MSVLRVQVLNIGRRIIPDFICTTKSIEEPLYPLGIITSHAQLLEIVRNMPRRKRPIFEYRQKNINTFLIVDFHIINDFMGNTQLIEAVVKATDHNRKRIALVNKLVLQVVRLCGKLDTPMTRIIPCQKSPSLSPVAHFLVMPSPLSDKNARMAERLPSIPRSHNLWGISL